MHACSKTLGRQTDTERGVRHIWREKGTDKQLGRHGERGGTDSYGEG